MAQHLKGKDKGARALSVWLRLLLLKWVMGDRGMGQATSTPTWNGCVSFAGPRSSPVRVVLASSILPHFLVVQRTIFTVVLGWMGGQWNDTLGAGVARIRGGTDAMRSRSKGQVPAPPGMPLAWVAEMAGTFFSWTPGSLSGSQSRLARRLPRRLCRVEKRELQLLSKPLAIPCGCFTCNYSASLIHWQKLRSSVIWSG